MVVYVLVYDMDYEGESYEGTFSTMDAAKGFAESQGDDYSRIETEWEKHPRGVSCRLSGDVNGWTIYEAEVVDA